MSKEENSLGHWEAELERILYALTKLGTEPFKDEAVRTVDKKVGIGA